MEGIRNAPGVRQKLRGQLLFIRMCSLLRGRAAEPCGARPVSHGDQTRRVGSVPHRAGPQACIAQAPSQTLDLIRTISEFAKASPVLPANTSDSD